MKNNEKTSDYLMTMCHHCGKLVPNAQYCSECGNSLPNITLLKITMKCDACGGIAAKGKFCGRCGTQQERS